METTPTIDQAADFFDAHTVELYPDGSTVRFFNAAEEALEATYEAPYNGGGRGVRACCLTMMTRSIPQDERRERA